MRVGGVTGWLKASEPHWLEWQDWADPVFQKQYEMNDGSLHIPDVPGVGLD
jgi:mandelate racemase